MYNYLLNIIPKNNIAILFVNSLKNNTINNISICCNPYCNNKINTKEYFAFDGWYCNEKCQLYSFNILYPYWEI